uniref:ribosomal protein S19 n=1 Tax=Hydnora abyssinica TaxID=470280 RepID=UPI0021146AE1|nr:ribosomal protein S19 [Hydnora abyssinica]USN93595.1 ribosomal protein S19 [Hydnora abyssinica]
MKNDIFVHNHILQSIKKIKRKETIIKTWSRASNIIPAMVGYVFSIYNGRTFFRLFITKFMIGHKIGEFIPTLTYKGHKEKKKKKKLKKKKPQKPKLTSAIYKPESQRKIMPKRKQYSEKKRKKRLEEKKKSKRKYK